MLLETEILDKYKSNQLQGIYVTELCFYMPIRVTGTGKTIRRDEDKYYISDRVKSVFLSDELVEACSKLPVILYHPDAKDSEIDSSLVSHKTLKDNPIIGQTIYAYRKEDEVWAIARIYDRELLDRLGNDIHSTSPGVYSYHIEGEDGSNAEIPTIFNHIAFVERGHWDQKSEIAYDDSKITIQGVNDSMADLEQKVEKIEQAEKKEAEHYKEMGQEHQKAVKDDNIPKSNEEGANVAEEKVKDDEETTVVDEETETELEVKDDEETETESKAKADDEDEEVEIEIPDEDIKAKVDEVLEEKAKADAEDEVEGETENDEDEERENIIDTMTELADSVDEAVGFKKVFVGKREKPSKLLGRILKANKHLVDSKYISLADNVNYSNYGLAVDAFNNLIEKAERKHTELAKTKHKRSGARWERLSDGISVDRSF